jgi:hypothetical protein
MTRGGSLATVPTFKDLYSVARETPTTRAMSATVVPPASYNPWAALAFAGVRAGFRPPTRPRARAAARPA